MHTIAKIVNDNIGIGIRGSKPSDEKVTMTADLANKIAWEAIYDINRKAAISWASGNHSGAYVHLFAIGKGAEKFYGVIDNTDIPKSIKNIIAGKKSK